MARIMIQGTASSVGKSIIVSALCRIFKQDGFSVCPYKSQNMSLNSYITMDGFEMGRAQVLQAYASGLEPQCYMNPILLKPTTDKNCQVIVNGQVHGSQSAKEYYNTKKKFLPMLRDDFKELEKKFDIIVIEGAGSPAEINLRENDIVNMGFAKEVDAPVILVGDIDKGGVFASLIGTKVLLEEDERKRIKGTIINKFRGDVDILKPGLKTLDDMMKAPCIGVVPYFRLSLEDEDGAVKFRKDKHGDIDIAVLKLPHMSNFTDTDALKIEEDVSIRYIENIEDFKNPDLLIIPGTKNTIGDLLYIRENKLENRIKEYAKGGGLLIGICGGYQMLGNVIEDPFKVETDLLKVSGLGLLNVKTTLKKEKVTARINARIDYNEISCNVYGYEIHMGNTTYESGAEHFSIINEKNGKSTTTKDGCINKNVLGTYIHGIFDGTEFRQYILNVLRVKSGLKEKNAVLYERYRDKELDKLADIVRKNIDIAKIYEIMEIKI
ncbi:MAG: cobyric acid synthase [Clostridium sp.]|nr:cobyric acid synthase [Clostridium sp.]